MDKELLKKMFLSDLKQKVILLKNFLTQNNFTEIKAIGHKIKGNSAALVFGFEITNEIGQRLEKLALENKSTEIAQEISSLETFLNTN